MFQGGYYAGAVCAIGIVSAVAYIVVWIAFRGERTWTVTQLLVFAVAALYLVSALVHGATVTMLLETATWFAVCGMSLWCAFPRARDKQQALDALAWSGVVLAIAGLVMYVGALPLEGSVNAGRLMFTLQYANTSGLLFAVFAVLCLQGSTRRLRAAGAAPIAALLLTQSVGAIAVFAVAVAVLVVRWVKLGKLDKRVALCTAAALAAAVAAAIAIAPGRVHQATQTFAERLVQMLDALGLLAGSPLLGIGPDQWQFEYPFVQTARYRAADVHCSYLQVALDAGVPALAALVAAIAFGMWRLARRGDFSSLVCVAMIAAHALFDFDFQFASVLVVLLVLLAESLNGAPGGGAPGGFRASRALAVPFAAAVIACAVASSALGIYLDARSESLKGAAERADAGAAGAALFSSPVLSGDRSMSASYASALYASGMYAELVDFVGGLDRPGAAMRLQRASAFGALGMEQEEYGELRDVLHAHPYDPDLYSAARRMIVDGGLGGPFAAMFDDEASRANALAGEGRARWLEGQEQVELIGAAPGERGE